MNNLITPTERSRLIDDVLPGLAVSSRGVVGHEANYQAMLCKVLTDVFGSRVYLEYHYHLIDGREPGKDCIDLVLCREDDDDVVAAFEIKGGAYGDRNALEDTFDDDGYCRDMDRLATLQESGVSAWMIAIDANELGGLSWRKLSGAIDHVLRRGLGFFYFRQDRGSYTVVTPDGEKRTGQISNEPYKGAESAIALERLAPRSLRNDLSDQRLVFRKEADVVATLYRKLVDAGLSESQMSLETYFGFAPGGGMHQRPDLCIYESAVEGHFNLYPRGDRRKSYDPLKLRNLRVVIEVKGGLSLVRKKDSALAKIYERDIEKLSKWKGIIERQKHALHIDAPGEIRAILIAVDLRPNAMAQEVQDELHRVAGKTILFTYIHLPI